jgi:hypothetical protein
MHQKLIISSDPGINGDLLCAEIDPIGTRNQILYLFLLWLTLMIVIAANNKSVHNRCGNGIGSPGDQDNYF